MSELTDPRPDDRNGSDPRESGPLRVSRRSFVGAGMAAVLIGGASSGPAQAEPPAEGSTEEWRNKQPGMTYRRLGRTGMMVSEVVCGGDPITLKNFRHLEKALEMGLNYLDMAPAYNGGDTERAYGRLLEGSPSKRDKVFLTTKVSDFNRVRERMYQEIFDGLSGSKQEAINRRARALRRERAVEKPGYALTYFPGQQKAFDSAYRRVAMMAEYGERVEASSELRKTMVRSIEGSLKRVGTDHFDILMCPHGANTPEDLDSPEILETFKTLKQQGKVRFLGVTAHNDPAGVLHAAADKGFYDVVMMAYNVVNGGYVEGAIRQAWSRGVGLIAMKAAHAVATHHKALQPVPEWRIQKVDRIVPGDMKAPMKAYLWALQNPQISAVISNLWDETHVKENLSLAGRTVELRPA